VLLPWDRLCDRPGRALDACVGTAMERSGPAPPKGGQKRGISGVNLPRECFGTFAVCSPSSWLCSLLSDMRLGSSVINDLARGGEA
jgi:hypothetical protein